MMQEYIDDRVLSLISDVGRASMREMMRPMWHVANEPHRENGQKVYDGYVLPADKTLDEPMKGYDVIYGEARDLGDIRTSLIRDVGTGEYILSVCGDRDKVKEMALGYIDRVQGLLKDREEREKLAEAPRAKSLPAPSFPKLSEMDQKETKRSRGPERKL